MLITAEGVKDTKVTASYMVEIPEIDASLESMEKVLKDVYGVKLQ